jgi:hypothetical protein
MSLATGLAIARIPFCATGERAHPTKPSEEKS